jgi:hypothetical protein
LFIRYGDQETNAQELELSINELNCQEVSGTLTSLVKHAAALTHYKWRGVMAQTLVGGAHKNIKWTIAQVSCTYIPLTLYPLRGSRGISDIIDTHVLPKLVSYEVLQT